MELLNTEDVREIWLDLFKQDESTKHILDILSYYPETRSFKVSFQDVDVWNQSLGNMLLRKPKQTLSEGEKALKEVVETYDPDFSGTINLRVNDLGEDIMISKIRAHHVSRLISVVGIVKKSREVKPRITIARFKCRVCGSIWSVPQTSNYIQMPTTCDKDRGGCGAARGFELLLDECEYIDSQNIVVEESTDRLLGGEQPQKIDAILEDDLTGTVLPGDKVILTGVLQTTEPKPGVISSIRSRDVYIYGVDIEADLEHKYDISNLGPEDIEEIMELSRDPNLSINMRDSIAPQIFGMEDLKMALLLQQFGGVRKPRPYKRRGDIHILMVGDPGIAKSQILRDMIELAPRGRYASGKASSGAGLTAAAIQENAPDGSSAWTLEAGTLVLADQGVAGIDEIDKMREQDRDSMYEAMEQQTISVSKAGLTATLQARCAILSAANPKHGRILEDQERDDMSDIIELPLPLLSRFDLMYLLEDKVDRGRDQQLAEHIIKIHQAGEAGVQLSNSTNPEVTAMEYEETLKQVKGPVTHELLRKYIAYARNRVYPRISEEAASELTRYYLKLRDTVRNKFSAVPVTPRQLEAIIRLSEAYARIRLSNNVNEGDVQNAITILARAYHTLGVDIKTGDFSLTESGKSSRKHESERNFNATLNQALDELVDRNGIVAREDIFRKMEEKGHERTKIERALEQMVRSGKLMEKKTRDKKEGYQRV